MTNLPFSVFLNQMEKKSINFFHICLTYHLFDIRYPSDTVSVSLNTMRLNKSFTTDNRKENVAQKLVPSTRK